MSLLSSSMRSTGTAVFPLDIPMIAKSGGARGDTARFLSEENWENEGGHLAAARPAIACSPISVRDVDMLEAQVNDMESALASNLANGRLGIRYNSYAHRSRVLRQQQAKLEALHAAFLAQGQPS